MDDDDTNCIAMETLEEAITNDALDDLLLNAIKSLRNDKKRPDCYSIYDFLSKSLSNSDITKQLISSRLTYLTKNNKLKNKQTNGKNSYFILKHLLKMKNLRINQTSRFQALLRLKHL